ncbi:FGGY family carbohydrate kinase [Saccharopolyspora halophila]|uniref:FGGY family carbohydrate kinase n=1 Tax=Saccharopolyspora halophila TaxID=405551 RepID=UPI003CD08EFD
MVEQTPERLWNSVCGAFAELTTRRQERVVGIALSTQHESVLAWDAESGCATSPLTSWQDRRTANRCAKLLADHPSDITTRSPACRSIRCSRRRRPSGCSITTTSCASTPRPAGSGSVPSTAS